MFKWFRKGEEESKFCRDCKWFEFKDRYSYPFRCTRMVKEVSTSLVLGPEFNEYRADYNAEMQRTLTFPSDCGPKAKYFEPKENV